MAWRLASWPTRRSPLFVNATTDGVIRPPSAFGMIVGSPPSITATAEFVVPRSMPITRGMCLLPLLGDGHHCRANDPVVQPIRLLMLFDDCSFGFVALDVRDGVVQIRIERLSQRIDGLQPLGLEDLAQLALDEPHALDPRRGLELLGDRRERPVVRVEYVEELRDEVRFGELRELDPLGVVALAEIGEIRGHALQRRKVFVGRRRRRLGLRGGRLSTSRALVGCFVRMQNGAAVRAALASALLKELLCLPCLVVHQSPSMTRTRSLMSDPTYRTAPMDRAYSIRVGPRMPM